MCYFASLVRQKGHEALLVDFNNTLYHTSPEELKKMWDDKDYYSYWEDQETVNRLLEANSQMVDFCVDKIIRSGAGIIGFTVHFSSSWASLALARKIKERDKTRIIVFGGPDCARQLRGDYYIRQECVDIVVHGEGEKPLLEIIEKAQKQERIEEIKGGLVLKDGKIIEGGYLPGIEDLDTLPIPDYSDFKEDIDLRLYREPHRLDIFDSHSCPTHCHFCSEWQFWGKFRSKSGERIFEEVRTHMARFPQVNYFYFIGSLVNGDISALEEFCDLVTQSALKITWAGQAVIRQEMTPALLGKMKDSGCSWLGYGIESGSPRLLERVNKKFSLEEAARVLRDTKAAGISTQANFMFGIPGETKEDFQGTLDFLKKNYASMDSILASQSFCVIDKGTYLYNFPTTFGIVGRDHNIFWESNNGQNNFAERFRRYEEFCQLALSLGIPETSGVLREKPDKWMFLGDYYAYRRDYRRALENYLKDKRPQGKNRSARAKISTCYEELGEYSCASQVLEESLKTTPLQAHNGLSDERIRQRVAFLTDLNGYIKGEKPILNYNVLESQMVARVLMFYAKNNFKGIDLEKILADLECTDSQRSMARALYSHGLWEKLANYLLVDLQKKRKETFLCGYPYWLIMDPSNLCNLSCPFCPTGQKRQSRTQRNLDFNDFRKIVDVLGPYLIHIDLVNWGEPLLNEKLFQMITYAKQYRCDIKIDTNLNLLTKDGAERLVLSGLDKIVVSLDGLAPQTYARYRRGGDFQKVMDNLKLLIATRTKMQSKKPYITWQFLVFRHNEHEIQQARELGEKLGVDHVGITKAFIGDKEWIPLNPEYSNYKSDEIDRPDTTREHFKACEETFCAWPWEAIAVNSNASISACCSVEDEKNDFGFFFDKPFAQWWNSDEYRIAREYIRDKDPGAAYAPHICVNCAHLGLINVDVMSCHSFFDAL